MSQGRRLQLFMAICVVLHAQRWPSFLGHEAAAEDFTQETTDTFVVPKNAASFPYAGDGNGGNAGRIKSFLAKLPEGYKARVKFFTFAPGGTAITYPVTMTPLNSEGKPDGLELHFPDWYRQPIHTVPFQNGLKHGTEIVYRIKDEWNEEAKRMDAVWYVFMEVPWENGEVHGTKKTFHSNGKLGSEAHFERGELTGESRVYDDEGRLTHLARYTNGKKHGDFVDYWPSNGNVKRIIPYKDGIVDGVAKEFYLSGKLKWERPFKNNLQHGEEKHYEENGALVRRRLWKEGEEEAK